MIDIDIAAVRAEARQRWKQENATGVGLLARVEHSVPWWLIVIAAVMFFLSAPHTASTFGQLTPVFGWAAPLGVEFGLLYGAFRRKRAQQQGLSVPKSLWALEVLLFLTAIIVNGAGALAAVVSAVSIQAMSTADILAQFSSFPATTQVALVLVPIAALIIPIGTSVTGEGLATLVFERTKGEDDLETKWREVEFHVLRKAFFEAYLKAGMRPADAKRQAAMIAAGFIESPAVSGSDKLLTTDDKPMTKRQQARQLLRENPAWKDLPLRDLAERTGIDHNTWSMAKKEFNQNGRHHE